MEFLSCIPEHLYGAGGFFETTELLQNLIEFSKRNKEYVRFVADLYKSYDYIRPPAEFFSHNSVFVADIAHYYSSHCAMVTRGAASSMVCLRSGVVFGSLIFSDTGSGLRPVYETNRENDRPWVKQVDPSGQDIETRSLTKKESINFFLCSAGSGNYGHWLIDDLPRSRALAALQDEAEGRTIRIWLQSEYPIIDHVRSESLQQICAKIGPVEVRLLKPNRFYAFSNLYYATPISYHPGLKCPEAMQFLVDSLCPTPRNLYRRIFITRRDHGKRSLTNIVAIQSLLEGRGFKVIDVEAMTFAEQVDVFSGAEVIVGCMGAAMTNCAFAPKGALTLYLAPEGWLEPFYWDLAAIRSHRYAACYGPTSSSDVPAHLSSYSIDPDLLTKVLDRLLPE